MKLTVDEFLAILKPTRLEKLSETQLEANRRYIENQRRAATEGGLHGLQLQLCASLRLIEREQKRRRIVASESLLIQATSTEDALRLPPCHRHLVNWEGLDAGSVSG